MKVSLPVIFKIIFLKVITALFFSSIQSASPQTTSPCPQNIKFDFASKTLLTKAPQENHVSLLFYFRLWTSRLIVKVTIKSLQKIPYILLHIAEKMYRVTTSAERSQMKFLTFRDTPYKHSYSDAILHVTIHFHPYSSLVLIFSINAIEGLYKFTWNLSIWVILHFLQKKFITNAQKCVTVVSFRIQDAIYSRP